MGRMKLVELLARMPPERRARIVGFAIGAPVGLICALIAWFTK